MFRNVAKVVHYVTDVDRARRFYQGVLGLSPRLDLGEWVELDTDGATLCLHAGARVSSPVTEVSARVKISLAVESMDAAIAHLASCGVPIEGEHRVHDAYWIATIRDPDGNAIDLAGPR